MINAEDITNAVSRLILNDAGIQAFCQTKFSKNLSGEDNLIVMAGTAERPTFTVVKLPEKHNFNEATNNGYESEWDLGISFFGSFSKIQIDNDSFEIPAGTLEVINGVNTYTPSDTMRILARMAVKAIYGKIGCEVPGVLVSTAVVDAEDYYDAANGEVKSILQISLYKKSSLYN